MIDLLTKIQPIKRDDQNLLLIQNRWEKMSVNGSDRWVKLTLAIVG